MVRGPISGNGAQSPVHYLHAGGPGPARSRAPGVNVEDPQRTVVTLLALVNGQLMKLGVPVAATGRGNGMAVSGSRRET